jgi:hypothetical protein
MMVTNIQHFLDDNGEVPDLPPEAQELLSFLAAVVQAATITYGQPMTLLEDLGHPVIGGTSCTGNLEVWVYAESNEIGWECLECGEEGIVTDWEGTAWDRRNYVRH